jgi:DNA-directed RNA polymerase subunit RPC12/RpoP
MLASAVAVAKNIIVRCARCSLEDRQVRHGAGAFCDHCGSRCRSRFR